MKTLSRRQARVLLVVMALFAVASAITGVYLRQRATREREPVIPLHDAMPLALGDRLELRQGDRACDVTVLGVPEGGRVLAVPCGAREPAPLARADLRVRTSLYYQDRLAQGDIALVPGSRSWSRALVLAPLTGGRTRVRAIAPGGAERVIGQGALAIVQRAGEAFTLGVDVPLPVGAPLAPGDLVTFREGERILPARVVEAGGGPIRVQRGSGVFPDFQPDTSAPVDLPASALWVRAARTIDAIPSGAVVLVRDGDGWVRRVVVGPERLPVMRVRAADGSAEELRPQEGWLLVRGGS